MMRTEYFFFQMKPLSSLKKKKRNHSLVRTHARRSLSLVQHLIDRLHAGCQGWKKNAKKKSLVKFCCVFTGFCCFFILLFFCFIPRSKVFIRHFLISLLRAVMFCFFFFFPVFCRRIQEGNSFCFEFFLIFISPSSLVSDTYAFFPHSLNCYLLQFHWKLLLDYWTDNFITSLSFILLEKGFAYIFSLNPSTAETKKHEALLNVWS